MTRKHFVLIAAAVAETVRETENGVGEFTSSEITLITDLVDNLAYKLATTNGAFDRARFVEACGVPASKTVAV